MAGRVFIVQFCFSSTNIKCLCEVWLSVPCTVSVVLLSLGSFHPWQIVDGSRNNVGLCVLRVLDRPSSRFVLTSKVTIFCFMCLIQTCLFC